MQNKDDNSVAHSLLEVRASTGPCSETMTEALLGGTGSVKTSFLLTIKSISSEIACESFNSHDNNNSKHTKKNYLLPS